MQAFAAAVTSIPHIPKHTVGLAVLSDSKHESSMSLTAALHRAFAALLQTALISLKKEI